METDVFRKRDFREQARRILEAFGLAQDERRARLLFESRSELFHRLISGADKDRSGTVSWMSFCAYFERQIRASGCWGCITVACAVVS